tara:strand:+ start:877 stop:1257 length:381 start_codon:yes stop_codon:yes gene_type:complete
MNNPQIYSDGVANSIQDSPLRVQNKILGALKNLGGEGQTVGSNSGKKSDTTSVAANTARKDLFIQNIGADAIYIKMGSGAGASDYHFEVAGNNSLAGTGGTLNLSSYTGVVSIHPSTNDFTLVEFE